MITPTARLRPLIGSVLAVALVVVGPPWSTNQVAFAQDQVIFVSPVDSNGDPVTDLEAHDLQVRWDDEVCETLSLERINWPVRVTVFVDNGDGSRNALQHMREGLKLFVDAIPEEVEVALLTIGSQPRWVTRRTVDREELERGVDLITPDIGASSRFMDALIEEAARLNDDEERQYFPVIVMVATDGPDGSTALPQRLEEMLQRLIENSATVHTRMFSTGSASPFQGLQVQVGVRVSEVTRGSYESLAASTAFVTALPELGQDIARKHTRVSDQYRLTYAPPDGVFDQPRIRVAVSDRYSGVDLFPTLDGNLP
jgi:hypothetical protein